MKYIGVQIIFIHKYEKDPIIILKTPPFSWKDYETMAKMKNVNGYFSLEFINMYENVKKNLCKVFQEPTDG